MDHGYQNHQPRTIVRRAAIAYVVGQSLMAACLIYAFKFDDIRFARMLCLFMAWWGPWLMVVTWKQSVTAWKGIPPDDLNDVSIPSVIMMMICGAIFMAIY